MTTTTTTTPTAALKTVKQRTPADRESYHVGRGLDFLGSVSRRREAGEWTAWTASTAAGIVGEFAGFTAAVEAVAGA
jgi:hypothetical protein